MYRWDFGDGEARDFAPDPVAIHRYTEVGKYDVVLTVRDPYGAEDYAGLNITVVNVPPTVHAVAPKSTYEDLEVTFEGYATDTPSDQDGLRFQWDFGDGYGTDLTSEPNASHVYIASGNYSVVLTVKDPNGAVVTARIIMLVQNLPPTAEVVSPTSGMEFDEDSEVWFKGAASDTSSDNDSLAYRWDFGDGEETGWGSYSLLSTEHTFTEAGVYQVTLFIKDNDDAMIWDSVTIHIENPPPEVWTGTASKRVDEDESFTLTGDGTDTESDLAYLEKAWLVGDMVIPGTMLTWTFTEAGEHIVVFRVMDDDADIGKVDVVVTVQNVEPSGTAEIDRTIMIEGDMMNFSASVEDTPSDLPSITYRWEMGDGTVYETLNGSHVFDVEGLYKVNFTATDDDGAIFFRTFDLTVREYNPPDPPRPPPKDDDDGSFPFALVAGGAAVAVLLVIVALFLLLRRPSSGSPPEEGEP
jgi:PKD repeat protein